MFYVCEMKMRPVPDLCRVCSTNMSKLISVYMLARASTNTKCNRKVMKNWLVVSTPLKNISQLGWLFPIYGKIKNVPNHQPENLPKLTRPTSLHDKHHHRLGRFHCQDQTPQTRSTRHTWRAIGSGRMSPNKSNANWCKLIIQSSVWQKTWSVSGLCIQHGMRSCQFLHDSALGHLFGVRSTSATPCALSNLAYPCVVVAKGYIGWVMWCLTLASLEHHSDPLWNGCWNLCPTSCDNQDFPHGFAGRNHYIEQNEVSVKSHPIASNFSGCPVWKPFFTSVLLLLHQYYAGFATHSKWQDVWHY